ncbi:MAG: type II secretion system F family protein [Gemmatimonadota bacterium]|nr:MAG: type II secretion system F family protein [Gemmatimonadota bacterium]
MALVHFARQFATLVDAAVPLVHGLEIAQDLSEDRRLKKALSQVIIDVQAGRSLADAMKEHPGVFSDIFVNMVEAGEQGGVLDSILARVATYLEKSQALVSKVKTALVYPAIIFFVAIASAAVMLAFVVPTFETMFASGGLSLPYPTQVLVNMSEFLQANWIILLAVVVGGAVVLRQLYQTSSGRLFFDSLFIRVPVLGDLIRKAAVARFAQSMSSLLTAGANLIDALIASAATAGNVVIERGLLRARTGIEAGQGISTPLAATSVMPRLVSRMVEVGEQTGRLDEMFEKVAQFYEGEVDTAVDRLMKALEPALIVVVGFILGGMVVALYLPIFEALTQVAP